MSNPWLFCPKPNPIAQFRLFCFPCAGGLPASFYPWSQQLYPHFEVLTLQLPERGQRIQEPSITDFSLLIQAIIEGLKDELNCPFIFLGHSFGALLGFELIHQLRQQNYPIPQHFFACGCAAPAHQLNRPHIHHLPDDLFIEELSQRYQAIPDAIRQDPQILELFLPSLKADYNLFETYSYQLRPSLDCPITVLSGWQDSAVSCQTLWNWHEETQSHFNLYLLKGDHFFIHQNKEIFDIITQLSCH